MNQVFPNLKSEKHLVFEAANGAGKTIVALSSAIAYKKSLGVQGDDMRIVVLSRTNSQADRVIDELLKMKGTYPALAKRGKESMCNNPDINAPSKIPFLSKLKNVHTICESKNQQSFLVLTILKVHSLNYQCILKI